MQRIILSLALIAVVVGTLTYGATNAFFSDSETSTANVFTAGAIDLKVDNESYYNGVLHASTTWEQTDLTIEKFFDFLDLKPADYGEDTISLHIETNDAYLCANVTLTSNDDNGINEPESAVDQTDGAGNGELASLVNFLWWADDGDNVLEDDETVITQGNFGELGVGNSYQLTLAAVDENIWTGAGGFVLGNETLYIGKAWCFGSIAAAPLAQDGGDQGRSPAGQNGGTATPGEPEDGGITCDGTLLGNESQTDSLTADVSFVAVQARHNENFQCESPQEPRTTLTLIKSVLGGESTSTAWTLSATGNTNISGVSGSASVTNAIVLPGSYDLSETNGPTNYTALNWSCVGGNQTDGNTVNITEGQNVTCTITNYLACTPQQRYADTVTDVTQGVRKNGTAIDANRSDATKVLGAPQSSGTPFDNPVAPLIGQFFSLGFNASTSVNIGGGSITVAFNNNYIVDGPGNDLRMWEITGGTSYPVEKLKIEVSQDGSTWFEVASSLDRDAEADLADSGLTWARYVRLTDVSDRSQFEATADGYDLDAFSALNCADRTVIIN